MLFLKWNRAVSTLIVLTLILFCVTPSAHGACNVIPTALKTFRGAKGVTNRPFAKPGDWVEIALDSPCHEETQLFPASPDDVVVSIAFVPPAGPS